LLEPLWPETGRDQLMGALAQAFRGGAVENSVG
jgi:hypothetical protein